MLSKHGSTARGFRLGLTACADFDMNERAGDIDEFIA
jgi:hypothetical protein